ncbi:P-loop containing nucleoside triphosphate hydrolase protein, partial [Mycena olivaceomarginata]
MPQITQLQDVLEFTTLAARTIQDISSASKVPFLGGTAILTLSIVEIIKSLKSSKDEYIEITEQIQEILTAIIVLYESTQIQGVVPPTLLSHVVNFTETLRKIHVHVKAKQGMGRFKQLLNLSGNELQVKACKAELQETQATLRLQISMSTVSTMFQMQMDTHEKHKALMDFLAAHPEIGYSDSASQVSGTLSGTTGSSPSMSMLPPAPKIFYGRDSELQEVIELLTQDSPRIAILGPGGIGKTSLAQVALHHEDVVAKYLKRYFVPCHSSLTSSDLISTISSHIGFESAKNLQHILQYFTCSKPSLLVLDNFETLWEPASTRLNTEEFLSQLAGVPQLALLITMRGAEHPQKTKWTRPFLQPLTPLSNAAAWRVFVDIAEDQHELSKVQQLLDITGNLPLAVSLMANVVAYEGCDRTLSRWNHENTHLLSDGHDQRSSLDISIMLSYSSPRMTSSAKELLSILSMLPDGLSDADLVQSKLPLENILTCKSILMQVSLAHVDNTKCLRCLVPIGQYIQRVHPPSSNLKYAFRQYLNQILSFGTHNEWNDPGNIDQVMDIAANCHNILSDVLENCPLDLEATINNIAYLNRCLRISTEHAHSDLMEKVWPRVTKLSSTGKHGVFFYEMLMTLSKNSTTVDVIECIEVG